MTPKDPRFALRLARAGADLTAAQRLRYRVFVEELGGNGALVDHDARLERDEFDDHCDHLVLVDLDRDPATLDHVIGVYRLMRRKDADQIGGFYTAREYDLTPLLTHGRNLLELGRSCVDAEYRGGKAMYYLWGGLADYVAEHGIEILFGVASFHGTDVAALAEPLSLLHHRHLAPQALRVRARAERFQRMDLMPEDQIDRPRALRATPALIKAYLRLGGFVGEGAYVDDAFNTTDVCLILDTASLSIRQRDLYTKGRQP
jgi:putative hemolysin